MTCPRCGSLTIQDKKTYWECEECSCTWDKIDNQLKELLRRIEIARGRTMEVGIDSIKNVRPDYFSGQVDAYNDVIVILQNFRTEIAK